MQPLLPSSKSDNPIAFKLASNIIKKSSNSIQNPISIFVNDVLVGTSSNLQGKSSELAEHIYPLLYELHKISPSLLLKVLPNICLQLQVDEEEVRSKATKLLGVLFSSSYAEYAAECPKNFKEFTGRSVDVSMKIRLLVIDSCISTMKNKPLLRKTTEGNNFDVFSCLFAFYCLNCVMFIS